MRIRDGDSSDPGWKKVGSGINIPDPQHWMAHKCKYFNGQAPVGEVAGSNGRLGVDDAGLLPGLDVPQSDTVVRGTYEVNIHQCCCGSGSGIQSFF